MADTGMITMSMREVDRFKVIQAVTEARLKPGQAAERLGLTVRQIERLVIRYRGLARLALHTPCRQLADKYVEVRLKISRLERLLPEECRD